MYIAAQFDIVAIVACALASRVTYANAISYESARGNVTHGGADGRVCIAMSIVLYGEHIHIIVMWIISMQRHAADIQRAARGNPGCSNIYISLCRRKFFQLHRLSRIY